MKQENKFTPSIPLTLDKSLAVHLNIQLFNINSIKPHMSCYLKDKNLQNHHIICIQETWLMAEDHVSELHSHQSIRQDQKASKNIDRVVSRCTFTKT